jgi:A/G-specific adenine glycosylase
VSTASFAETLLVWFRDNRRDLPWRRTKDPYAIWVSEVMLQQTRVATVIPYYESFLRQFPDITALAAARDEDVLAACAGLGYYHRARNMHRAARAMNGTFPRSWEAIRALPGVGEYTAAAVASIAFGLPHIAVDGNVLRVAARLSNDHGSIGSLRVRSRLHEYVAKLAATPLTAILMRA